MFGGNKGWNELRYAMAETYKGEFKGGDTKCLQEEYFSVAGGGQHLILAVRGGRHSISY